MGPAKRFPWNLLPGSCSRPTSAATTTATANCARIQIQSKAQPQRRDCSRTSESGHRGVIGHNPVTAARRQQLLPLLLRCAATLDRSIFFFCRNARHMARLILTRRFVLRSLCGTPRLTMTLTLQPFSFQFDARHGGRRPRLIPPAHRSGGGVGCSTSAQCNHGIAFSALGRLRCVKGGEGLQLLIVIIVMAFSAGNLSQAALNVSCPSCSATGT
jgi:hypothetical protein